MEIRKCLVSCQNWNTDSIWGVLTRENYKLHVQNVTRQYKDTTRCIKTPTGPQIRQYLVENS